MDSVYKVWRHVKQTLKYIKKVKKDKVFYKLLYLKIILVLFKLTTTYKINLLLHLYIFYMLHHNNCFQ